MLHRASFLVASLASSAVVATAPSFPAAPSVAWSHLAPGGIESAAALTATQALFSCSIEESDPPRGSIFGLNRRTGAQDWAVDVPSQCLASGVVGAGALFIGCDDNVIRALELVNGKERWRYEAGGEFTGGAAFSQALGLVIAGCSKPSLVALDAASGAVAWEFAAPANVASTPVLSLEGGEAYVYAGDDDGHFFKLAAKTGDVVWGPLALGAGNIRCPANVQLEAGRVLLSAGDPDGSPPSGAVLALAAKDGAELWRSGCDDGPNKCSSCWTTPTVVDGVVVVGCGIDSEPSGKVWGLAPGSGKMLWKAEFPNDMQMSSPLALPDGKGFVLGNLDGHVYCLEAKTGDVRWKWRTEGGADNGGIWSTPRLTVDDDTGATIYVASHDKRVYALREGGGDGHKEL